MKNFRRLCLAVVLAAVFAVPVLADGGSTQGPSITGDTQGPSVTGQLETPPGAAGITQTSGEAAPGDVHTPGVSVLGDINTPPGFATFVAFVNML